MWYLVCAHELSANTITYREPNIWPFYGSPQKEMWKGKRKMEKKRLFEPNRMLNHRWRQREREKICKPKALILLWQTHLWLLRHSGSETRRVSVREDAYLHWLHLFNFSPLCVFKWVLNMSVCTRKCIVTLVAFV